MVLDLILEYLNLDLLDQDSTRIHLEPVKPCFETLRSRPIGYTDRIRVYYMKTSPGLKFSIPARTRPVDTPTYRLSEEVIRRLVAKFVLYQNSAIASYSLYLHLR